MSSPADPALDELPPADRDAVDRLVRGLGVDPATARKLAASGHRDPEAVRGLSREALREAGLDAEEADRISPAPEGPSAGDDAIGDQMMRSVRKSDAGRRRRGSASPQASAELLKRWVDGDDTAMESWIRSPPTPAPSPSPAVPASAPIGSSPGPTRPSETSAGPSPTPAGDATAAPLPPEPPEKVMERERAVLGWLSELLDRAKTDQFDPAALLPELQELQRQLHTERARRAQLEEEAEQVKRGSIAVIKYVRSREATARESAVRERDNEISALKLKLLQSEEAPRPAGAPPDTAELEARLRREYTDLEQGAQQREADLQRRLAQADGELRELKKASGNLESREAMLRQQEETLPEVVAGKLREFDSRDKELTIRESELRSRFEQVKAASDELDRQKEPLRFKEKQLSQWEVQLRTLKQTLEVEARTVEKARLEVEHSGGGATNPAERSRLEELKAEITKKEDELAGRERLLHTQMEELQSRIAGQEAETMHVQATADAREVRQPTGVRRLDDLLFGGLPAGSQVLLSGPAHTGKELLARLFVAEGLKRGIPAIWVVADKTFTQVREEMTGLLPSYRELERRGLVRYVDLYSRGLGVTQSEPGVRLFQSTDRGVLDQLTQTVNAFSQELKEKAPTYRLVFESVSTVTAYLDTAATFRFLQPFTGRRRLDGAAAYYLLETGMHSESDLETIEHMVDGSINLKVEQLKTFLSVRGIADVQSRAWVGYTFTKRAFSLGSFSLDHIR